MTTIKSTNIVTRFITEYDKEVAARSAREASSSIKKFEKDTKKSFDSVEKNSKKAFDSVSKNSKKALQESKKDMQAYSLGLQEMFVNLGKRLGAISLGAAVGSLINKSINEAANFEVISKSFEVLVGNANAAKRLLKELNEFSVVTPFQPEEINNAARTLLGFGRSAQIVKKDLEIIGNAAAATGGNIQNLALVFGQVAGLGKLDGKDTLQLINQGIPVYKILAQSLGKSREELVKMRSEGKITFDILRKAFEDASKKGGLFENALQKQSTTLKGLRSTAAGVIKAISRNIGERLLPGAKNLTAGFIDLANSVNDYIKVPLSKAVREEQISLNLLVDEIEKTNEGEAKRAELIDELDQKYPFFLKNLDKETVSNNELLTKLKEVNNAYVVRAALLDDEEKLNEAARKAGSAASKRARTTLDFREITKDSELKLEIDFDLSGDFEKDFQTVFNEVNKIFQENSESVQLGKTSRTEVLNKRGRDAQNLVAQLLNIQGDLKRTQRVSDDANKAFEKLNERLSESKKILLEQYGLTQEEADNILGVTKSNKSASGIPGGPTAEDIKTQINSLKDYENQIKTLKERRSKTSDKSEIKSLTDEIEVLEDRVKGLKYVMEGIEVGSLVEIRNKIKDLKEDINKSNDINFITKATIQIAELEKQAEDAQLKINSLKNRVVADTSSLENPINVNEETAATIALLNKQQRVEDELLESQINANVKLAAGTQSTSSIIKQATLEQIELRKELLQIELELEQLKPVGEQDIEKINQLRLSISKLGVEAFNVSNGDDSKGLEGFVKSIFGEDVNASNIISSAQDVFQESLNIAQQYVDEKNRILDQEVAMSEDRLSRLLSTYKDASAEQIEFELNRLDKSTKAREKAAKKRANAAKIEASANILAAIARIAVETGVASLGTLPAFILTLGTVAAAAAQIFHEGTEYVGKTPSKSKKTRAMHVSDLQPDEVPAILQVGERVIDKDLNKVVGNIPNHELVHNAILGMKVKAGRIKPTIVQNVLNANSNDQILREISNKLSKIEAGINSIEFEAYQSIDSEGLAQSVSAYQETQDKLKKFFK